MAETEAPTDDMEMARALIEELLRTGFAFTDLLSTLIEDLPDDAFPGEDKAAVVVEMVVGSCLPAVQAAGSAECRAATALIGAVWQRVVDDLRAALALSQAKR